MAVPGNTIRIDIKKPGHDPVSFEVAPATSFAELRKTCDLVGYGIFYKGIKRNSSVSLLEIGVKSGDALHAFPPTKPAGPTGSAQYHAARRLGKGLTQRSTAHQDLHRQTQAVVMDEGLRMRETVVTRCDGIEAKVDKLLELHGKTTAESDRVINAVATLVQGNTQPNPDTTRMAAKLASSSTTVKVLNSILKDEGMPTKGTKEEKATVLADSVPVHKLLALTAEHAGVTKPTPKAKAKSSPEIRSTNKANNEPTPAEPVAPPTLEEALRTNTRPTTHIGLARACSAAAGFRQGRKSKRSDGAVLSPRAGLLKQPCLHGVAAGSSKVGACETSGAGPADELSSARRDDGDEQMGACETARALEAGDTVKILAGQRAGAMEIVTEVQAGSYEVDEHWYERSALEFQF